MTMRDWFEMRSERKPRMQTASWIPLYRDFEIDENDWPQIGYKYELIMTRSAIFPACVEKLHEQLDWSDLYLANGNRPEANEEMYSPARELWSHQVRHNDDFEDGEFLVFEHQTSYGREILLLPDLICALRLERFNNSWVHPKEGHAEVIRELRYTNGTVHAIEIRAKHLKDYLCARKSQLAVGTFRSRKSILESDPDYRFENAKNAFSWFEFGIRAIDERGFDHGKQLDFSIYGFSETDHDDDVPIYGFNDERETWRDHVEVVSGGTKRYSVGAEMVLIETVMPADRSPIVRDDEVVSSVAFIIDNDDTRMNATDLVRPPNRWLWFSPRLVNEVLSFPKTSLRWLTADTGLIDIPVHAGVHFGVNERELINIFAKDIGELPCWWQERFVSYNVPPEGGVSRELIAAQMECRPADTSAPESQIRAAVDALNEAFNNRFGCPLFSIHESERQLWRAIHRFASLNESSFYELAKNILRAVVERIDMESLKSQTQKLDKATGSIKRIACIIDQLGGDGRGATTVLVGVNELRQRDSHLPSAKELDNAYSMAGINRNDTPVSQGKNLIFNTTDCLVRLAEIIRQ